MSGLDYELAVGGQIYKAQTDENGVITQEVPAGSASGTLKLAMWQADLTISPLSDANDPEGALVRLENLGYHAADATGIDEEPNPPLSRFQSAYDLQPEDDITAKLIEIYGS